MKKDTVFGTKKNGLEASKHHFPRILWVKKSLLAKKNKKIKLKKNINIKKPRPFEVLPPPAQLSFPHREPGAFHEVIEFLAQLGGVGHGFFSPGDLGFNWNGPQIMGCLNQKSVTEKQTIHFRGKFWANS